MDDYQGTRVGVIQLLNKINGPFSAQDASLLKVLASQSSIAIENARLYRQVSALRDQERALRQQLQGQHRQLQKAYLNVEGTNAKLASKLSGKRWARRLAGGLVLLLGVSLGSYLVLGARLPELSELPQALRGGTEPAVSAAAPGAAASVAVATRPVTEWADLGGSIRPLEWVEIPSPLDSVVTEVNFRYGEPVSKGQLLARLDTSELQVQLRSDNASYIRALKEVERLSRWAGSLEVTRARRDIARAEEALRARRRELADTRRLLDIGIVARQELETGAAAV